MGLRRCFCCCCSFRETQKCCPRKLGLFSALKPISHGPKRKPPTFGKKPKHLPILNTLRNIAHTIDCQVLRLRYHRSTNSEASKQQSWAKKLREVGSETGRGGGESVCVCSGPTVRRADGGLAAGSWTAGDSMNVFYRRAYQKAWLPRAEGRRYVLLLHRSLWNIWCIVVIWINIVLVLQRSQCNPYSLKEQQNNVIMVKWLCFSKWVVKKKRIV